MRWERSADRTVLVVEDDAATREVLGLAFEVHGYDVAAAANGREALDYLRGHPRPGVILLDLMMPVVDGAGFMELYRQVPGPHAPIIVITAAEGRYRSDSLVHAQEVVPKPLSLDHLIAVVRQHTGHRAA